jgi:hypothetical protein
MMIRLSTPIESVLPWRGGVPECDFEEFSEVAEGSEQSVHDGPGLLRPAPALPKSGPARVVDQGPMLLASELTAWV